MICPECGAALQVLSGPDGWQVVPVVAVDARGQLLPGAPRVEERRTLANVYACPACEFMQAGAVGLPGDTWAAWCRRLERSGVARQVAALSAADDLAHYAGRYGRARSAREFGR